MANHVTRTGISISPELLTEVDRVRGDLPRSRFIVQAIKAKLELEAEGRPTDPPSQPTPPRATKLRRGESG